MPIDLRKIPTADLEALQTGDLSKVSTATLNYLNQRPKQTTAPVETNIIGDTPEWAGRHPNLYGMYGAGKELLRTGIEATGTAGGAAAGALIPAPGTSLVGAGLGYAASKRGANVLFDEPVDMSAGGIAKDVALGGIFQGAGKLIGKIPGVGRIFSPDFAAVGPQKTIGSKTLSKTAETIAEKSLKVTPSTPAAQRKIAIDTMLDEKIPITKGGLSKTKNILDDLNDQMDSTINSSSNVNNLIKVDDVLGPVQALRDKLLHTVNGSKLANQLDDVVSNFKTQYGDSISIAQAQAIKQNTNALLRKSYGELKNVETESIKQIVRGLKDRIAVEIPEISGINVRYSRMKILEKHLERAVNRSGNWDLMGLLPTIAGATVGGTTGSIAKAAEAGTLYRIMRSPAIQSRLAIILKSAGVGSKANIMANAILESTYNKMVNSDQTMED